MYSFGSICIINLTLKADLWLKLYVYVAQHFTDHTDIIPISDMHFAGLFKANGTITLIKGTKTVLVDCGLPMDKDFLIESEISKPENWSTHPVYEYSSSISLIFSELAENQVDPNGIHFVIGTHGHSDHIGNLNLFPSSTIIVSYDICNGDIFEDNKLKEVCSIWCLLIV